MRPTRLLFAVPALALLPACIIHIDGGDWDANGYRENWSRPTVEGNGVDAREERVLPTFDAIQNDTMIDISVQVGGDQHVALQGDENVLAFVMTEVRGGSLEVRMQEGRSYDFDRTPRLEITVPRLRAFAAHGHGDAEIEGVVGDAFALSLTGHGDTRVSGEVDQLTIEVNGHGDVDAFGLKARRASVKLTGHGDVKTHVSGHLDARVTGHGDVRYRGNPSASVSIAGQGSIQPASGK